MTTTLGVWSGEIVIVYPDEIEEPPEFAEGCDALDRYYEDHPEALEEQRQIALAMERGES